VSTSRATGSTLIVGLLLLALISALALSAASTAHVELSLARNERFRENAASAASAGIESAISRIVSSPLPESAAIEMHASLPAIAASFEVRTRFLGHETGLPQVPGAGLVGAHFEIIATGHSSRGAYDRQRAIIMRVVDSPVPVDTTDCEPLAAGIPCVASGQWRRLSWQRLARE
jgi:hypothetical protein